MNKKSISPVIAVILLLSITVILSVGVYQFLQNYSQNTLSDLNSNVIKSVKIIGVYNDNLYLQSNSDEIFSVFQIQDLNGNTMCEIKDSKQATFQGDTRLLMTFNDENSTDISGLNNPANLTNGVNCTITGVNGKSCLFDGINDYIDIGNLNIVENGTASIVGWFKFNQNASQKGSNQLIINSQGLVLYQHSANNYLYTNSADHFGTCSYLESNKWNHIALIYSGDTSTAKLYLNKELCSVVVQGLSGEMFALSDVRIGGGSGIYFNGSIDEVAIYSKILNENEIKSLYDLKQAKFYEQLLTNNVKEINVSSCGLSRNQKYNFIGVFESGSQIKEEFIAE